MSPTFTARSALFHPALAHRVVTDQVIVGDHDMGKLIEDLINLMMKKSLTIGGPTYTKVELQAVIDGAKVAPIRVKKPNAAPAAK